MNLYKLSTVGIGDFYVISKDPTSAQKELDRTLARVHFDDKLPEDKGIINIRKISTEISDQQTGEPVITAMNRLIIVD